MYMLIRKEELWDAVPLDPEKLLFCDTETMIDPGKTDGGLYGKVRLIQIYQEGWDDAIIIDCVFVPLEKVLAKIKPLIHVYHHGAFDIHTINCATEDVWLPEGLEDTLYLSRLALWKEGNRFGFYQCLEYCNLVDENIEGFDKKENQQADWGGVLTETMLRYAACDVIYLFRLYEATMHMCTHELYKLDIQNLKYAIEYCRRGIPVDELRVRAKLNEAIVKQEKLLAEIPVNPNSPKQVCKLLGVESSARDVLVELKLRGNEMAGKIRAAREVSKTVTFLHKYSRPVIYGFINPCGTITGRMSCTGGDRFDHDNIQQIPRRVLDVLVAALGKTLVYADYSGVELKMSVAWIDDPTMKDLIMEGVDIHSHTGSILYKKPANELTDYERMIGKICNFLLIYGGSVKVLRATIMGWGNILMPINEVKEIWEAWFDEYEYFREWHKLTKKTINVYGYADVNTALGRNVRTFTINDALNVPVQGSCAEANKVALAIMKQKYPNEYLINTIHDSNTLMVPIEEGELWAERLTECMIAGWDYVIKDLPASDIPMKVDAKVNTRWEFA